ncbi:G2/mitotic-specific cyclin-2-like isoform X2 [Carica papaya]|uniref:G2/mitotic-specific cyclin-2-like isoform X2 n=1 Tax=Carica papaya TaxID=3649 RepID=UPI000B8CA9F5|nr:G2/mitotic-specific cyclin-2-like isoform X2 [Carica papaya]
MVISDENNPNIMKPTTNQGLEETGVRKFGQEIRQPRRALRVINQNLVGPQAYPCVVNKRGLSERDDFCEKNLANPAHRPITRRLASQISSSREQKPPCPEEERRKLKQIIPSKNVEEQEMIPGFDHPIPMALEETDEYDPMEEVEMEDVIAEDHIMDIDSCDAKNPLAVVEYVDEIYDYYRKMESYSCVSPNYMAQQMDINERMRAILIDWLIEVHDKFDLMKETLFLTVNLIDRFLSEKAVVRKKLQLVGLVAMLLACKYEEVSVPIVEDLVLISDKAYTRNEVLDMEKLMLNTLQFNMSYPTPYVFIKRFLKAAQSNKKVEMLSFFLMEVALIEYEMLKFPPSLLAAAAIYTAQCSINGFGQWNRTCECHSLYSEDQLLECSRLMVSFHLKSGTGKLTGVYRKYCTSKFGYTAKCEPAQFLLETKP